MSSSEEREIAILNTMRAKREEMSEAVTRLGDAKRLFEATIEDLKRHQASVNEEAQKVQELAQQIKALQMQLHDEQVAASAPEDPDAAA